MRKIAATLVALLAVSCVPAQASPASDGFCRVAAEASVTVASLSRKGDTWKSVEGMIIDAFPKSDKYRELVISVHSDAFYLWANLEPQHIRQLAYLKCQTLK